jgi:hypothetical protein
VPRHSASTSSASTRRTVRRCSASSLAPFARAFSRLKPHPRPGARLHDRQVRRRLIVMDPRGYRRCGRHDAGEASASSPAFSVCQWRVAPFAQASDTDCGSGSNGGRIPARTWSDQARGRPKQQERRRQRGGSAGEDAYPYLVEHRTQDGKDTFGRRRPPLGGHRRQCSRPGQEDRRDTGTPSSLAVCEDNKPRRQDAPTMANSVDPRAGTP